MTVADASACVVLGRVHPLEEERGLRLGVAWWSRVTDVARSGAEARDEQWVGIGRVGRPHGLDGAFVVEEASTAPERFQPGARVYLDREPATVVERKRAGGRLVVRLDRKAFRGGALELRVTELPPPEEGSYYAFQLVGLRVDEEGGATLGAVAEVEPGVANDVLRLDSGVALPLVEECVRVVDLEAGRLVVAPGFADEPDAAGVGGLGG